MILYLFIIVYDYVKGEGFVGKFSSVNKVQMVQIQKDCNLEKVSIVLTFINVTTKDVTTNPGQK